MVCSIWLCFVVDVRTRTKTRIQCRQKRFDPFLIRWLSCFCLIGLFGWMCLYIEEEDVVQMLVALFLFFIFFWALFLIVCFVTR